MVIKSLYSFIKDKKLGTKVSLQTLAEEFIQKHQETPTIFIDCSNIHILYHFNNKYSKYGWNWNMIVKRFKIFVRNLREIGIEPKVYFRGKFGGFDAKKWINWVETDYNIACKIYESIDSNEKSDIKTLNYDLTYFRFILKYECKCQVYNIIENIYPKLADIAAKQDNCLGIISMNLEYILFDTKPYFTFYKMDFDNLSTDMLNASELIRETSLNLSQLKLLSCLLGNELIPKEKMLPFYEIINYVSITPSEQVQKVIELIRRNNWSGSFDELPEISRVTGIEEEFLHKGLSSYQICFQNNTDEDDSYPSSQILKTIEEKWKRSEVPSGFYDIVKRHIFVDKSNLEDSMDGTFPRTALLYRPMRQKMYRVIFGNDNVVVNEWCMYDQSNYDEADEVTIHEERFDGFIPPLDELLSNNIELQTTRWKLFLYCLDIQISMETLQKLNPSHVSLCCILNYMLKNGVKLKKRELMAFICQALHPLNENKRLLNWMNVEFSSTTLRLCNLLERGIYNLMYIVTACGFPFRLNGVMPWKIFNRKIFLHVYEELHKENGIETVSKGLERNAKLFRSLVDIVIADMNT
ncbi:constitutive coactivator of peroxisome proliferator-activated receptor gamma-like [Centruroides sculpturatus]|uniref:constitutive coactivator of peroxisome proliferator-activated receptor gamma-like n=1 Tax=Centruroides sculpturatus TaxID=218467 RepID=UPI000C6CCF33|nr:constitutive coactivator of peroxisome proliferator-activated receptor gamma-like [Centruroides sculpturatus]